MYSIKESAIKTMLPGTLDARQQLFEEVLPAWENRIFKLAMNTFPKVDQRLMEIADVQQELRIALWEAVLSFEPDRGMVITSWIFKIINQASSLIAKLQYYKMPHSIDGHGMQLLALEDEAGIGQQSDQEEFEQAGVRVTDPDAIGRIETNVEKEECIRVIRPILKPDFEQSVFDLFMAGYTGGEIVKELGLNPKQGGAARVSSVRLKIKIAYAIIYSIPRKNVSSAKNVEYLDGRIKHLLSNRKEKEVEPEEIPSQDMYPQFV